MKIQHSAIIVMSVLLVFAVQASSANACGDNTPEKLTQRKKESFYSHDITDDNKLSLNEFLTFKKWQIYTNLQQEAFFKVLDDDTDGFLDFMEWEKGFPLHLYMTKCVY